MFVYIWPKKSISLQLTALFCFMLLVIGRVINLLVPIFYKYIVGECSNRLRSNDCETLNLERFS